MEAQKAKFGASVERKLIKQPRKRSSIEVKATDLN